MSALTPSADFGRLRQFVRQALTNAYRPASGLLRHPYISPGAQYAAELWDWDSYWFLYALLELARQTGDDALRQSAAPYAIGTLRNFLEHQGDDGAVPLQMRPDDADTFDCLASRDNNMAKPFFGQLVLLLWEHGLLKEDETKAAVKAVLAFHACYDARYLHEGTGLVVWAKDWGIGVDDDPCAWGRPPRSCASVFLNTCLLRDAQAIRGLCRQFGMEEGFTTCQARIERLSRALETFCWDERESAFFSLDVQCQTNLTPHRRFGTLNKGLATFWQGLKMKVLAWQCLLPFWTGLGTQAQMDAFVAENLRPGRLWSEHGVRSLSQDEPMYAPEVARGNPSNWLGPIWLVANYITWETLMRRGHAAKAAELAHNITTLLAADFDRNGCLHEFYSPESGAGVMGAGFMSWNALAALMAPA